MWRDILTKWAFGDNVARALRTVKADAPAGPSARQAMPTTRETTSPESGGSIANEELYVNHPWVYACVDAIAKRIADIEPVPSTRPTSADTEPEPSDDAWLNAFVACPNKGTSWFDLIEGTSSYLELNGNAFWELSWLGRKDADPERPPDRADLLRSDRMVIVPSAEHRVSHYEYTVDPFDPKGPQYLPPEKILHFKFFNPLDEQKGMGPATPAESALNIDQLAVRVITDFLDHSALMEGVLKFKEDLNKDDVEFVQSMLRQRFSGAGKTHGTMVLGRGADYQVTQATPVEAGLTETRQNIREDILAVFGVPPVVVGVLKDASWANAHEQKVEFWGGTLMPKIRKIYSTINTRVQQWRPELMLVPNLTSKAHFLDEYEGKHREREMGLKEITARARTPDEYRSKFLALPKTPDKSGGVHFVPATSVPAGDAVDLGGTLEDMGEDT